MCSRRQEEEVEAVAQAAYSMEHLAYYNLPLYEKVAGKYYWSIFGGPECGREKFCTSVPGRETGSSPCRKWIYYGLQGYLGKAIVQEPRKHIHVNCRSMFIIVYCDKCSKIKCRRSEVDLVGGNMLSSDIEIRFRVIPRFCTLGTILFIVYKFSEWVAF